MTDTTHPTTRLTAYADAYARHTAARGEMAGLASGALLDELAAHAPSVTHFVLATPESHQDGRLITLVDGDFHRRGGFVTAWHALEVPDFCVDTIIEMVPLEDIFAASVAAQFEDKYGNIENYVSVAKLRAIIDARG